MRINLRNRVLRFPLLRGSFPQPVILRTFIALIVSTLTFTRIRPSTLAAILGVFLFQGAAEAGFTLWLGGKDASGKVRNTSTPPDGSGSEKASSPGMDHTPAKNPLFGKFPMPFPRNGGRDTGNSPSPHSPVPSPQDQNPVPNSYANHGMGGTANGFGPGSVVHAAGLPSLPAAAGPELAARLFA